MSEKTYTYQEIITEANRRLKGESYVDVVGIDYINGCIQTISNMQLWWWWKQQFSILFNGITAGPGGGLGEYNLITKRLPENINDIIYAWQEEKRESVNIISRQEGENIRKKTESGRNGNYIWLGEDTCLDAEIDNQVVGTQKLQIVSDDPSDTTQKIYLCGVDENKFKIFENVSLNGTTAELTTNKFYSLDNFYLSTTRNGKLTITQSGGSALLSNLPADKLTYSTKKIYCYPVLNNITINFIGVRKAFNFNAVTDIPDFPQQFIPNVLINKVVMELSAYDKNSHLFQASQIAYQEGINGMVLHNNMQMAREYSEIPTLNSNIYPSQNITN